MPRWRKKQLAEYRIVVDFWISKCLSYYQTNIFTEQSIDRKSSIASEDLKENRPDSLDRQPCPSNFWKWNLSTPFVWSRSKKKKIKKSKNGLKLFYGDGTNGAEKCRLRNSHLCGARDGAELPINIENRWIGEKNDKKLFSSRISWPRNFRDTLCIEILQLHKISPRRSGMWKLAGSSLLAELRGRKNEETWLKEERTDRWIALRLDGGSTELEKWKERWRCLFLVFEKQPVSTDGKRNASW